MQKGLSKPLLILFMRDMILYSEFTLQGEELTGLSLYLNDGFGNALRIWGRSVLKKWFPPYTA